MTQPYKIIVLISGNGSNLQAIIDHVKSLPIKICAVISNQAQAYGIQRAIAAGIPVHVITAHKEENRDTFDSKLRIQIEHYQPNLIVLAGFMRFLGSNFVQHFYGQIINIHPSLLPKYQGLHTHQRALDNKDPIHGISIHFVNDDLDGGPIICQASLSVSPNDNVSSLKNRIQTLEHYYYPRIIEWFSQGRILLSDEQVALDGKILAKPGLQLPHE